MTCLWHIQVDTQLVSSRALVSRNHAPRVTRKSYSSKKRKLKQVEAKLISSYALVFGRHVPPVPRILYPLQRWRLKEVVRSASARAHPYSFVLLRPNYRHASVCISYSEALTIIGIAFHNRFPQLEWKAPQLSHIDSCLYHCINSTYQRVWHLFAAARFTCVANKGMNLQNSSNDTTCDRNQHDSNHERNKQTR